MKQTPITARNLHQNWVVFVLLIPTVLGVALFSYWPALQAIVHSFYNWDGAFTEEFVGLENFRRILGNLGIWTPLALGGVLGLFSGMARGRSGKLVLRVMAAVALAWAGVQIVRDAVPYVKNNGFTRGLMWVISLVLCAAICLAVWIAMRERRRALFMFLALFLPVVAGLTYLIVVRRSGDQLLWLSFRLIFIMVIANLFTMWPSIFTAVCIHRLRSDRMQYVYRVLFVIPMIIPAMVGLLIWKFFYDPNVGPLNMILNATGLDNVLVWLDKWVLHLGVFVHPFKPAWLGDPSLIIPALIFWGFPWVGAVGVLIYLAGLQNISNDVYEAAELDGVGWWGKFWRIELPLIMTQVRLNLILMVIGTFQAYGFQLILLGPEGGPSNKGMTPGLYMFYQAFQQQNYGYACAIGLSLFFIILLLTVVNQRYVRVEK